MKKNVQIEVALRNYVERMLYNPENFTKEEGQALDRAVRSFGTGISNTVIQFA